MKRYNKTYLLSISLLGCTSLLGLVKPPASTKQAQELVSTAQKSTNITQVQDIHRALQSVRKKFPTPFAKVDQRLKELQKAQPTLAVSPADQKLVAQLQKQLKAKQAEFEAAQKTCMIASRDQTSTTAQLQQEVETLKTQLQSCRVGRPPGPPGPPPDAPNEKVKGPPVPPPLPKQERAQQKGRAGLLEGIRKGVPLKKVEPEKSPKPQQDALLDIVARRRAVAGEEENGEDSNDGEDEDWV